MNNENDVTSNGWWSKKCRLISIYVRSYYFYIHLILLIPISIIQLRCSVVYEDSCTIEDRIIVYLYSIAIVQIIYTTNGLLLIFFSNFYENSPRLIPFLCIDFLIEQILLLFLLIWFLIGNYLVFHIKAQVQFVNSYNKHTYCDHTFYQIIFWLNIIYYISFVVLFLLLIFFNTKWLRKQLRK